MKRELRVMIDRVGDKLIILAALTSVALKLAATSNLLAWLAGFVIGYIAVDIILLVRYYYNNDYPVVTFRTDIEQADFIWRVNNDLRPINNKKIKEFLRTYPSAKFVSGWNHKAVIIRREEEKIPG